MVETKKALSINIPISVGGPAVVTLMSNQKAQTMVKNILRVGYNEGFLFVTIETNNSVYKDIPIPVFAQSNFMNGQIIEAGSNVPVNNGGYITVLKILNITERGIFLINILRFSIYYTKHILKDVEPFTILSLIAYVYSMYKGRKNINRKNSPVKKAYDKGIKISVAEPVNETSALDSSIDKNNGFALISLSNHFVYEQRSRQGGHHSFHKSPVEHERVGHQRVYRNKDGSIKKIVNVKPSIINKGKGEGVIYQTRLPK